MGFAIFATRRVSFSANILHKGQPSGIQFAVDDLVRQAEIDKFQLNETKCKELQISFSRFVDP